MENNYRVDKVDREILKILMEDALTPYSEIARKLIISAGTVHVRMKRLTELGIVKGAQVLINEGKFGYGICAFVGIQLQKSSEYTEAVLKMKSIPEIVELHYTTGTYSILAKIFCKDTEHLREILTEKIQVIQGIQQTETFISLEENIKRQIKFD